MNALIEALSVFEQQGAIAQGDVASEACRVFHGRGQCYEGLGYINIDWFAPLMLVTLYQDPGAEVFASLTDKLSALPEAVSAILIQRRYIKGGPIESIRGDVPEAGVAQEQGLQFELSFGSKQNIGYFMDMSPGRQWLRQRCEGKRVLNLFAYTCAFSVAAIASGARTVVNVDMSRAALNIGRKNHQLNGQQARLKRDVDFLPYNLFRSWKKVIGKGPYDIVIIDPPSRQKGSFVAEQDYGRVLRRLPDLLADNGDVLACLNAPELGEEFLHQQFADNFSAARFVSRLPNRTDFPEADSARNLKMFHYSLAAAG